MTDWEFVFDGVVGFLTSPVWNIPIVSFTEKHCIVFDPSEENQLVLTEIHKEYSSLVEELLTSYLQDVGISEEEFVMACEAGSTSNDQSKVSDRSIFEQVWAAEDFGLFKSIMVKKNLDLELQALHMIQKRNGVVPKVFESEMAKDQLGTKSGHQSEEERLLTKVMKMSEEEYRKEKERKKEIEKMEKTLALSSKEESERLFKLAEDELKNMERMVHLTLKLENRGSEKSASAAKSQTKISPPKKKQTSSKPDSKGSSHAKEKSSSDPSSKVSPPSSSKTDSGRSSEGTKLKSKPEETKTAPAPSPPKSSSKSQKSSEAAPVLAKAETPADAAKNWLSSAMAETKAPLGNVADSPKTADQTAMDEEIAKRAQYMRAQREKLINLKKEERAKRLNSFEQEQPVKRPMSSRVARRITTGTGAEEPQVDEQGKKQLELRRALAARLKKEVIDAK